MYIYALVCGIACYVVVCIESIIAFKREWWFILLAILCPPLYALVLLISYIIMVRHGRPPQEGVALTELSEKDIDALMKELERVKNDTKSRNKEDT